MPSNEERAKIDKRLENYKPKVNTPEPDRKTISAMSDQVIRDHYAKR